VLSNTLLQAVTPAGTAGTVILEVTTPAGTAQALYTYVPPAVPTIGSVTPASGAEAGGTVVTIVGTAFTGATDVTFGGTSALPNVTVLSDTLIQAVAPAGTGTVILEVVTPNGNAQALYTYVPPDVPSIGFVSPTSGPAAGGTVVTVTGTGFTGTSGVTFGGTAGTDVTVLSDTRLQVVTPAHAAGTVPMVVTTPGGTAAALYTYY